MFRLPSLIFCRSFFFVNIKTEYQKCLDGERDTIAKTVNIGNGVWIGGGTVVLHGVTIGENTVIGAGSVVTKSIPANCVAVGNPCRVIRRIEE